MSQQHLTKTQKFLADVNTNEALRNKLFDSPASAWVAQAKSAGYEMTVEELCNALIGKIRKLYAGEVKPIVKIDVHTLLDW